MAGVAIPLKGRLASITIDRASKQEGNRMASRERCSLNRYPQIVEDDRSPTQFIAKCLYNDRCSRKRLLNRVDLGRLDRLTAHWQPSKNFCY